MPIQQNSNMANPVPPIQAQVPVPTESDAEALKLYQRQIKQLEKYVWVVNARFRKVELLLVCIRDKCSTDPHALGDLERRTLRTELRDLSRGLLE